MLLSPQRSYSKTKTKWTQSAYLNINLHSLIKIIFYICPYWNWIETNTVSRTTKTTNTSNLAKLKLKHHRRNSPIHTQNKAPQTVRLYTHSIQSTKGSMSKQSTTDNTSLYALKTKHHRRYVPIHTQKKHHRWCFTIHTQNKTSQTVCHYTHLKQSTRGGTSL